MKKPVKRKNKSKKILIIALLLLLIVLLITFSKKGNNIQKQAEVQYGLDIGAGITVDTSKVLSNEPNAPLVAAGMIPVKNVNGEWQITTKTDGSWYDYSSGKFATVMLSDGYYKSELQVGIDAEKQLAENHVGDAIPTEQLGTIYVWMPRIVYENESYRYLVETSIVEAKGYTMPSCFTYKQKQQPQLAVTGIWVERTPMASKTLANAKVTEMNTEENIHGLIKNEVVEIQSGVAKKVVNKLQEGKPENAQQVQNPDDINRTMIRIISTNVKTPIIVTAKVAEKKATINVTYSQYGVERIISLDKDETIGLTNTVTMSVPENGTYEFAVIDKRGNIKLVTVRVGDGTPDLVGFKVNTTYVVTYSFDEEGNATENSTVPIEDILKEGYEVDKNNALVKGTIDSSKVASLSDTWYNYPEQKWANIVVRNNGSQAYFTWIPRYVYQLDNENETSTVKFVTTENIASNGEEMDLTEWTLPEAFTWENAEGETIELPGYWMSKYELSAAVTLGLDANIVGGINKIRVNNITNTTGLTNITYDVYLYKKGVNRVLSKICTKDADIEEFKKNEEYLVELIKGTTSHIFDDLEIGDYEIKIVLNDSTGQYRGENWFTATVIDTATKAGDPDLVGFRVNTTYIVTYTDEADATTMDASIAISEILADGYEVDPQTNTLVKGTVDEAKVAEKLKDTGAIWYDYNTQKWANVVVRNNGGEAYYTWIPRYIYKLDTVDEASEIQFISIDDEIPEGWTLPEAFTWGDTEEELKQLPGYWMSKYELTTESTFAITADVIGGANNIRISSVTDNDTSFKVTYRFYLYESGDEAEDRKREFFAEPEAEMSQDEISNDHDCGDKNYVRYSEGLTEVVYYGLNSGIYDLRIVAYDDRGYYRGEQWFNNIEVIETLDSGTSDINEIIKPGLMQSVKTGFNQEVTYYVSYDESGKEILTPITSNPPDNWYDYNEQKWANIVVKGNNKTAYFVYIPRYIYKLDTVREETEIRFVTTDVYGDKIPKDWILPEAFTWGDSEDNLKQLPGYWMSKYELSN